MSFGASVDPRRQGRQTPLVMGAYRRLERGSGGSGGSARLNRSVCLSDAPAGSFGAMLPSTGDDLVQTDVEAARAA